MATTDPLSSLWRYALDRYARPGAETLCLQLQDDHGWDVCELLWVAWLAERRLRPAPDMALDAVRRWQREMTLPLRQRRRELKRDIPTHPHLEPLHRALKQAELLAERETLQRLERLPVLAAEGSEHDVHAAALHHCRSLNAITAEAYPLLRQLFACWLTSHPDAEPISSC